MHPMAAFAEEFLDRQVRYCKPNIRDTNANIVRDEILPAFGGLTVDAITVKPVRDWFASSISDQPVAANRFHTGAVHNGAHGGASGYRRNNANPCKNTRRYKIKSLERFLTAEEQRIHASGLKIWIVQTRIEGRSRRVGVTRYGGCVWPSSAAVATTKSRRFCGSFNTFKRTSARSCSGSWRRTFVRGRTGIWLSGDGPVADS